MKETFVVKSNGEERVFEIYTGNNGTNRTASLFFGDQLLVDLDAEAMNMLAVALYGATENYAVPIPKSERTPTFRGGDLVIWQDHPGDFEGGSHVVWGKKHNRGHLVAVAARYGGGLLYADPDELRVVGHNPDHY